ncbi:ABC transporter permease [Stenotrophomonas sp. NPDC077420]
MKIIIINVLLFLVAAAGVYALTMLPLAVIAAVIVCFAAWMALTASGRTVASVTLVGLSTLRDRLGTSSVIILGMAGVVGVFIALLAMGEGFRATLQGSGSDETAIVTRSGALAETSSVLVRSDVDIISHMPGVARDAKGDALVSAELTVPVTAHSKGEGELTNLALRGVDPDAWQMRPRMKIVEGRTFTPGLYELVVGRSARARFAGLEPGQQVRLGTNLWTVVGAFESGDAYDSELWGDRQAVAAIYRRGSSVSSVQVKLDGPQALKMLQDALANDPRVTVDAVTTREFFARQSNSLFQLTKMIGLVVGTIMGIGALFGALNCMFAAVEQRAREIGTLRAIGFQAGSVVISVMLEAMWLALIGGAIGAGLAWLIFNGKTISTLSGFSELAFQFKVTPDLMLSGLRWALAIGFIGGLFPAARAATMPLVAALRED